MKTSTRTQFLELVTQFRLATESSREALASEFQANTQKQATNGKPVQPVLGFCMDRAGSKERAESMFNFVLARANTAYWPLPAVDTKLRSKQDVKNACFKHGIVPIKLTPHMIILCGTNPHDVEGIREVFTAAAESQFPVFVLSEPERIMQALTQFA